jgi:hypothetical protein
MLGIPASCQQRNPGINAAVSDVLAFWVTLKLARLVETYEKATLQQMVLLNGGRSLCGEFVCRCWRGNLGKGISEPSGDHNGYHCFVSIDLDLR